MGRNVDATLKNLILPQSNGDRSGDALANNMRTAIKVTVLTQAAYDVLGSSVDSNTIYITVG